MIPIDQTKLHSESQKGNCLAASLASILELSIDEIPDFDGERWFFEMEDWLLNKGFELIRWTYFIHLTSYSLVMGKSPRGNFTHLVVYQNGELVHDPHPSRQGLENVQEVWALLPLNPAIWKKEKR